MASSDIGSAMNGEQKLNAARRLERLLGTGHLGSATDERLRSLMRLADLKRSDLHTAIMDAQAALHIGAKD